MIGISELTPILEAVVSRISEGVILTGAGGEVLYHNSAAEYLLGFDSISTIGDLHKNIGVNLPRALTGPVTDTLSFEQKVTANGITRFLEFNAATVSIPGDVSSVNLLILNDVTGQRRMEAVFNENLDSGLITQDPGMIDIGMMMEQVAPTRAPVLIEGESGTGKTMIARMIHKKSTRRGRPFVELNCAAMPESLIESELFGHVKGAFTGAVGDRPGRFQAAHGGTLFLDEISEIPMHLQSKLLKVLDDQKFQMVGSDSSVSVDVRIIAASNQNLQKLVKQNKFRSDLYYRLAVIPVTVPPLRERPGDIPVLIHHMCEQLVQRGYPQGLECTQDTMAMLVNYDWPGNIRELSNAIEHAMILAKERMVTPSCLPQNVRNHWDKIKEDEDNHIDEGSYESQCKEIMDALNAAGGNRAEAARILDIDRSTLWRRMHRLGIA